MSWATGLQVAGAVLQVAGVVMLAVGITETRKAFFPEVDWWAGRWWRSFTGWVSARWRRFWRWVTGGGQDATAYTESLRASARVGSSVTARKSYGPLPDDEAERWRLVEGRFAELIDGLQDVQATAHDHEVELGNLRGEIAAALAAMESHTADEVRRLASSGLRIEAVSVFLIGVGLALSTLGLVIGQ